MNRFDRLARRVAQYRICLERDVKGGLLDARAQAPVATCFVALERLLESARIEIEGAWPGRDARVRLERLVVGGCAALARRMFELMARRADATTLVAAARAIRIETLALEQRLQARLRRAA